jgi:hypothetical protein
VYSAYKPYKDYSRSSQSRLFKNLAFLLPDSRKTQTFFFQKTSESQLVTSFVAARVVDGSRKSEQVCGADFILYHSLYQITCRISIRLIDRLIAGCKFRRKATRPFTECVLQFVAWNLVFNTCLASQYKLLEVSLPEI